MELTIKEAERLLMSVTGEQYEIKTVQAGIIYPERYMRKTQIARMGNPLLTKSVLDRAERQMKSGVRKMDPLKKNSPIVFDTEELEKWRVQH